MYSVYLGGKVNADNFNYGKDIDEAIAVLEHFKQRRTRNEQTIQLRREQKLYQEPYRWR
jgi:hypothetical protein